MKFNKKFIIFILLLLVSLLFGCTNTNNEETKTQKTKTEPINTETETTPVEPVVPTENRYMLEEEEDSFYFFWETQNTYTLLGGCGLIPDRYPSNGLASIASVGFGLAAFVIGAEREYVTKAEAEERVILTLTYVNKLAKVHGFFYHFYYEKAGGVATGSEVSNIDTAIFLCGALLAGEYFGGEAETLALAIYDEVDWPWFVNKKTNNFYMAYDSSSEKFSGAWDTYAEQLMMYFLAAGSSTHPITKDVYYAFKRNKGSYKGETFINSWFGSIFTYQFSHAFVDFRGMLDKNNVNWFDNSVAATYANYNYCVDNPENFITYAKDQWGITACDTPTGYSGLLGTLPSGTGYTKMFTNDGTVCCAGAIGSLVFAPEIVMPVFRNYATLLNGSLVGDYGFKDAFNFDGSRVWVANSVIGIDKGITVMMIENYRSELIWKYFMKLDFMERAINVLEFTKVEE